MSIEGVANTEYASLSGKIHTIAVDKTLSISGACADAKATGDKIEELYDISEDAKEAYEEAKAAYDETVSTMEKVAREVAEEVAKDEVSKITPESIGAITKEDVLLPQIIVAAPIGSTVTCTKGDIALTTAEVDGKWTFDVPEYGVWVVNRSLDGEDVVRVVNVDTVKIYEVFGLEQLVNYTMLYDNGDECSSVTGGLDKCYYYQNGFTSYNENATNITWSRGTYRGGPTTQAAIDVTDYTLFVAKVSGGSLIGLATSAVNTGAAGVGTCDIFGDANAAGYIVANKSSAPNIRSYWGIWGEQSTFTLYWWFMAKKDNWEELCAFIGEEAPTTVDDLLADSVMLSAILNDVNAVSYMICNCTGDFMAKAVTNSAFLTTLSASAHKETVYANEHWAKFLAMVA